MSSFQSDVREELLYRLRDYGKTTATTPSHRKNKLYWDDTFKQQSKACQESTGSLLLIGDSIVSGLTRYEGVWNRFSKRYDAINCGI